MKITERSIFGFNSNPEAASEFLSEDAHAEILKAIVRRARIEGCGEIGQVAARVVTAISLSYPGRMPIEWHRTAIPIIAPVAPESFGDAFHGMQLASFQAQERIDSTVRN